MSGSVVLGRQAGADLEGQCPLGMTLHRALC